MVEQALIKTLRDIFPEFHDLVPFERQGAQKHLFRVTWREHPALLKLYLYREDKPQRFQREIEAYSKLHSPYVPRIYESGMMEIGVQRYAYIIEQYVPGITYRQVLDRERVQTLEKTLPILEGLLRACVDFDKASLVHRDIKPDNILMDPDGKVWVVDFGVVRILDMPSITATGLYRGVGTPGYAPPEQFLNRKDLIDSRTDLFSVGVVIYEALNGFNPYLKPWPNIVEILRLMEREDLPPLVVPGDSSDQSLSRFIAHLTRRNPQERPANAAHALEEFLSLRPRLMQG